MDVKIVEARPDHAGFLAWVTLTAFRSHLKRGFWDILLRRSEEERLRYLEALATSSEAHWIHQSIAIVAEVEGRPVAALSGYFEEEHGGGHLMAGMDEAAQLLGWTEEERADGWRREERSEGNTSAGLTGHSEGPRHQTRHQPEGIIIGTIEFRAAGNARLRGTIG